MKNPWRAKPTPPPPKTPVQLGAPLHAGIILWRIYLLRIFRDRYTIVPPTYGGDTTITFPVVTSQCECLTVVSEKVRKDLQRHYDRVQPPHWPHTCGIYGYYNPGNTLTKDTFEVQRNAIALLRGIDPGVMSYMQTVRNDGAGEFFLSLPMLAVGRVGPGWYVAADRGMRVEKFRIDEFFLPKDMERLGAKQPGVAAFQHDHMARTHWLTEDQFTIMHGTIPTVIRQRWEQAHPGVRPQS